MYKAISDADRETLENMLNSIGNKSDGTLIPVYFNEDNSDALYFFLVEFDAMTEAFVPHEYWNINFKLNEVLSSV